MFDSLTWSRQFNRYDLEYIRRLAAVKKLISTKFYIFVPQVKLSKV